MSTAGKALSTDRVEYTALSDRMGHLTLLRFAMGGDRGRLGEPSGQKSVGIELSTLAAGTGAYLAISAVVELASA